MMSYHYICDQGLIRTYVIVLINIKVYILLKVFSFLYHFVIKGNYCNGNLIHRCPSRDADAADTFCSLI